MSDVIGAGVIGAITAGKGYNPTVTWNAVGSYYQAEISDDNPFMAALLSKAGASVGYAAGNVLKVPFDKKLNPISKQYEWVPTGVWTITKPVAIHRVYRFPASKDNSPHATTGIQANFESFNINPVTGEKTKIGNGHLDINQE
ncbi:hypothetical protein TUM12370_29940 [Salmonella enterica subsp. enterica serovar Choleraesuis]|nr:hypothetical protein TUM12370_29940 [Salmonella enterica subsp. enterica serovar Choleraesuis]